MSLMHKPLLVAALMAALMAGSAAVQAGPVEDSMTKAGCMACHSQDKKIVGPAYKDVAAKYKGQDVAAKLVDKVRKGGSGVWGPIPMPPTGPDKIDDAQLKAAINLVLQK